MSTELAQKQTTSIAEDVLIGGDLSKLTATQRATYYMQVCQSVGLNPYTKPFDYITLNGKLVLYAKRDCTDQLRKINSVSCWITSRERLDDVYIVTAKARDAQGREDESTGVVSLAGMKGEALANALMKAETKAKRRVTLSVCGLGWIDETEVDSVPDAKRVDVDTATGEIIDAPTAAAYDPQRMSRHIHALAREVFGDGETAKADFVQLKTQVLGANKKTTELTRDEAMALLDALAILKNERAAAEDKAADAEIVNEEQAA